MKKVLVPLGLLHRVKGSSTPLQVARLTYAKKLFRYGLVPIFISPISPEEVTEELYRICDGVLCIGGSDFDPSLYGEERHEKAEVDEPERDRLEIFVIRKALEDRKPLLGICRGCQALAVAAGGKLHQYIEELVGEEDHGLSESVSYEQLADRPGHVVNVESGSRLHGIVGKAKAIANCGHHQAVKDPGEHMLTAATAPSGLIEAIEHEDPAYFCFGIQSHPETQENGDFEPIFAEFAEAVKQYQG